MFPYIHFRVWSDENPHPPGANFRVKFRHIALIFEDCEGNKFEVGLYGDGNITPDSPSVSGVIKGLSPKQPDPHPNKAYNVKKEYTICCSQIDDLMDYFQEQTADDINEVNDGEAQSKNNFHPYNNNCVDFALGALKSTKLKNVPDNDYNISVPFGENQKGNTCGGLGEDLRM